MKNLGDKIAVIAQPIARGIDAIAHTHIAGCGGCKQMQTNLNAGMSIRDVVVERWFRTKQQGEKMTYVMQIKLEADKVSEAALKMEAIPGVEVISCNPAPPQMVTQRSPQPVLVK